MLDHDLAQHLPEALVRAISYSGRHSSGPQAEPPRLTIALSREAGAGGTSVARAVGARLGWPVYDNELLELIAGNMRVRTSLLESVDERRKNWLEERVEAFAAVPHVSSNAYVRHLVETILSLGEHGECIIVGRGAPVLLPARSTLRVRLVAAWDDRVNVICRELGLSRADAARKVKAMDRERFAFVKEYFHRDPTDPLNYDLVLNTSRLSYDDSADVIVAAAQRLQARMARSVPRSEVLERELAAVPR